MTNIYKANEELPLISIIIPVYNVENYLKQCIESVLSQSYENTEIILVDDGSRDSCGIICDDYQKSYPNIKVIHKKNAGLGYARNTGLEVMSGSYVTFIDSDDWVSPDLISHMYDALKKNGVDFCKSGFKRVKDDGNILSMTHYENEIFVGEYAEKELLPKMIGSSPNGHDSIEMCVCAVLYDANIIRDNSIRFPSEREMISEDLVFNIDYLHYSNGACVIDKIDYYYRMNDNSLSHRYREDRFESSKFFYIEIKKMLEQFGYNRDVMLRLNRMFFIYIRMCIGQEKKTISGHDRITSIENIKRICENESVKIAIIEYPINQLGFKQRIFLRLVSRRKSYLLYFLANIGLF